MNIVHIVQYDEKFNYINFFMTYYIEGYNHYFIFIPNKSINNEDLQKRLGYNSIYLDSLKKIPKLKKIILQADKIIVSGVFSVKIIYFLLPNSVMDKVYLHFWGGDYTQYKANRNFSTIIKKYFLKRLIYKCKCILNLVSGEYDLFYDVFKIQKDHFVASFPVNPKRDINYKELISNNNNDKVLIVVGNSATPSNCHHDVFKVLSRFNNNFEVHCPLAYGENTYLENVINEGKYFFKDNFFPQTSMLSYEDYIKFLSSCRIGIFGNNRQQGMGNITLMLRLGKKVYMRSDTPMWNRYRDMGVSVYDIEELKQKSWEQILYFDENIKNKNIEILTVANFIEKAKNEWTQILQN